MQCARTRRAIGRPKERGDDMIHTLAEIREAGRAVRYAATMDSTNLQARQWAKEGAPHGALVVADAQTAGRGRRGRDWVSPPGAGLWCSLVLRPRIPPEQVPGLTVPVALAVAETCQTLGVAAGIKWPNDVVVAGRKVCGILLETGSDAQGHPWVVAGVGINVRQREEDFPPELRATATSLAQACTGGTPPHRGAVLHAFLHAFDQRYAAYVTGGLAALAEDWCARSVTLGRLVSVEGPRDRFTGLAEAMDETGALLVRCEDSTLRRVLAADVSVRGVMGYV